MGKGHATVSADRETRERLLDVAARLFAEHGFDDVTVRDICQKADANVAAVNYHFGGKQGLYEDVLRRAIRIMQATTDEIRAAGQERSPEARLEGAIRIFLMRVVTTRNKWIHQLMLQEVSHPTASFELILEQVITPRMTYVRDAIAGIMGTDVDDPRVGLCVMSVQAQLFALLNSPIAVRLLAPQLTPERVAVLAGHITRFSIAGIRAIAKQ